MIYFASAFIIVYFSFSFSFRDPQEMHVGHLRSTSSATTTATTTGFLFSLKLITNFLNFNHRLSRCAGDARGAPAVDHHRRHPQPRPRVPRPRRPPPQPRRRLGHPGRLLLLLLLLLFLLLQLQLQFLLLLRLLVLL